MLAAIAACDRPRIQTPLDPELPEPPVDNGPPTMEAGFRANATYHNAQVRLDVRYAWSKGQSDLTLSSRPGTASARIIDTIAPDPAFDVIVSVISLTNDTLATAKVGWSTQPGWRYGVGVSVSTAELPNLSCVVPMRVPMKASAGAVPDTMFVYYLGAPRVNAPVC